MVRQGFSEVSNANAPLEPGAPAYRESLSPASRAAAR